MPHANILLDMLSSTATFQEDHLLKLLAPLPMAAPMGPRAVLALAAELRKASNWRLLLRRVLLHIPRFENHELGDPLVLAREVERREAQLACERADIPNSLRAERQADVNLRDTSLEVVHNDLASTVHRSWHYLATPRSGTHLGLFARPGGRPEDLLALATLSPLDVPHLKSILPTGISADSAFIVSRLVASDGVPQNTMTYMMGRLFDWLHRTKPSTRVLLSYLNPNLAFRGDIYRASNWTSIALEKKKQLFYLDGDYATDREMIRRFGTNDARKLLQLFSKHVSISVQPLRPLEVLAYFIQSRDRRGAEALSTRELSPISIGAAHANPIYKTKREQAFLQTRPVECL